MLRRRAEFRMHLIGKIVGQRKRVDEIGRGDEMEIHIECAKKRDVLDDVCEQTTAVPSSSDDWITEEDKNLLRYYYYILHEVDDVHAGTLDSDTLKKITGMVSAVWQARHGEYFGQLIKEVKRDYITSMKKSVVDFVLQEPFEEACSLCDPVSVTSRNNVTLCKIGDFSRVEPRYVLSTQPYHPIILPSLFSRQSVAFCI